MPGKTLNKVCMLLPSGCDEKEFRKNWLLSDLELPACSREKEEGCCIGLRRCEGLYVQCKREMKEGNFCKQCANSFVDEGRPRLGLWEDRKVEGWLPADGKGTTTWGEYLKKKGLEREDVVKFLSDKDVTIPDEEWEIRRAKRGRRGSGVSDTSSEGGEGKVCRFLPLKGKRKSPPKGDAFEGKNGAMLRVHVYKETKRVLKVNVSNWTDEANVKFTEMYGGDGGEEGVEFNPTKSKKKENSDQMEAMQAQIAALMARAELAESLITSKGEEEKVTKKISKKVALKKKKDAEKAEKMAELQKKMAEQMKELEDDDDLGDFESGDDEDEEQDFNPYEHAGVNYHRDDENKLYTEDGDYFGHIDEEGVVHEDDE